MRLKEEKEKIKKMRKCLAILILLLVIPTVLAVGEIDRAVFKDGEHNEKGFGPRGIAGSYGYKSNYDAAVNCLMVLEKDDCRDMRRWAEFTMSNPDYKASYIDLLHLDSAIDDSFELYMMNEKNEWVYVGSYSDRGTDDEEWITTRFELPVIVYEENCRCQFDGKTEFRIVAKGAVWNKCNKYGQLGVYSATISEKQQQIPEFSTLAAGVTLLSAGAGFVLLRKRR